MQIMRRCTNELYNRTNKRKRGKVMSVKINIDTGEQVVQSCSDCKNLSVFEINKDQDPFYFNGKRLRECIKCGRYEEVKESEVK
tara:strand:- start:111 stop:362 length:252 start_codon:yes stop_codon:yes gene_type:complete